MSELRNVNLGLLEVHFQVPTGSAGTLILGFSNLVEGATHVARRGIMHGIVASLPQF